MKVTPGDEEVQVVEPELVPSIKFREDLYALAYVSMIEGSPCTETETSGYVKTCLYVFTMQVSIVSLLTLEMSKNWNFPYVSYGVDITRLICAVLLHMQLEPEIKQDIKMTSYYLTHPHKFKNYKYTPFFICCM